MGWRGGRPGWLRPEVGPEVVRRGPVPAWFAVGFAIAAAVLLPWIGYLWISLPTREIAENWRLTWAGFDVLLAAALAGTAIRILRRSLKLMLVSTASGTLLVCDAWFDILTSHPGLQRWTAITVALLLELPLAATCFRIAYTLEQTVEHARPLLVAAGYTLDGHRLVPPPPGLTPRPDLTPQPDLAPQPDLTLQPDSAPPAPDPGRRSPGRG